MDAFFNQIAGYFTEVPGWPFVLIALALICAGLFEIYNRKRHAAAVKRFRLSIHSILSGLYPEPISWPKDIDVYLCEKLPAMQRVIEEFRYRVPQEDIPKYNKDWHSYYKFCDEITDGSCNTEDLNSGEVSKKQVFHTLVSNILSHGK
jgi:hypothetical protein